MCIEPDDSYMWCGTYSGDVIVLNLSSVKLAGNGPSELFSKGITSIVVANDPNDDGDHSLTPPKGTVILGSGDGHVARINKTTLKVLKYVFIHIPCMTTGWYSSSVVCCHWHVSLKMQCLDAPVMVTHM